MYVSVCTVLYQDTTVLNKKRTPKHTPEPETQQLARLRNSTPPSRPSKLERSGARGEDLGFSIWGSTCLLVLIRNHNLDFVGGLQKIVFEWVN